MPTKQAPTPEAATDLRKAAEQKLAATPPPPPGGRSTEQLLHELQVHQIELEMQNETLRQTQDALQQSLDRYLDLYEFAPVVYMTLSEGGRITNINLTGAELFGENRKNLLDRPFVSLVVAEEQDDWSRHFRYVLHHPERRTCEMHLRRADGRILYVNVVFLLAAEAGGGTALRIALTDITSRRQINGEFSQMSLALAQTPVSIQVTDVNAHIVYVNPAFTAISGYSAAEVMGKNPRQFRSARTPPKTYEDLWATLRAGKVWHGKFINLRKDGTEYVEIATISPMRQADGRVTHYVAVKMDVTQIDDAMNSLQRTHLTKGGVGMGVFDVDLNADEHTWDQAMREIWGIGPDEPVSYEAFIDGLHPDDKATAEEKLQRALDPSGSGEYRNQYRVINKLDGIVRNVVVHGQAIFEAGLAIRFVGAVRDVTAEMRLESDRQDRRRNLNLLANQQVAAQTAAAIAHELNQPLVSVSAYSEAALRMWCRGAKEPDKLESALNGAVEQAQRAGETLHELLDFLHKGVEGPAAVDINEVVSSALSAAAESGYGGFKPVTRLEAGLRPVLANRLQMEKVLLNLLYNSVDAMRSAGIPTSSVTITVSTAAANKDMAQVTVQDSGPGLDAEAARSIFEPFFTTKPQGIGLGLSISRTLVEAHGGSLWLDPEQGPGATFHFTVPFAS
jgi:two-component system sensor kinase FixL